MNRDRIGKGYYGFAEEPRPTESEPVEDPAIDAAFEEANALPAEEIKVPPSQPEPTVPIDPHSIAQEFERLTPGQLLRLKRYAHWRMRGLGRQAASRTYEDLLSEAVTATISGERTWTEGVSFCDHLLGAMRSISSRWREKRQVDIYLDSELDGREDFGFTGPIERAASSPDPERILAAKEEFARVQRLFSKDPIALKILGLLALGYTASQIRGHLELSKQDHGAAVKRIRRLFAARYGL